MSSEHVPLTSGERGDVAQDGWQRRLLVDATRASLLFACCVGIGFALNHLRAHPLAWVYHSPKERLRTAVTTLQSPPSPAAPAQPAQPSTPQIIELEAFQAFALDRQGIVIDARAGAFYRQGHVPGALSLPREEFSTAYPALAAKLEKQKDKQIAVYCSELDCPDAGLVADALAKLGFSSVTVYQEGWEEWTRAGLPQENGSP